ncbi:uncharacterized protein RCC_01421 [Ramularia collo-cygni]|uniref:Trichothecene 3-O-acetyltransferase-like N-terminal domain-containing protein n=1 Tax=Ramularia collo-cygni TaxID=112498 RepID=A0A2D3V232_9PEZI|nr:uncharacterized protein RCC_01421 [Ramularia collo-cygni]CZT15569.1 uncharacterized protein RCC_01421 [Ramularia collo-cygni]
MTESVVFRLSSIDQSSTREYIRYALCYPCESDAASLDSLAIKLSAALKRGVSYMPILAGKVHPVPTQASSESNRRHSVADYPARQYPSIHQRRATLAEDTHNEQSGQLEVRVTAEEVESIKATFKTLGKDEFPHSYADLTKEGMPPMAFIGEAFTPLPDAPESLEEGSPVLAVQGNFISGGVIVALYLHHSVVGAAGLGSLMRCMSISEDVLPSRPRMTTEELRDEALEQSRMRDRLSGSRGYQSSLYEHPVYSPRADPDRGALTVPSSPSCQVLTFSLPMLNATRDFANEHFLQINADPTVRLSLFDCLMAVLWKALTRARWPPGVARPGQTIALAVPINVRVSVEPPLNGSFYGNSDLLTHTTSMLVQLGMPFDVSTIGNTASNIRKSLSSLTEPKVRSTIAMINECEDLRSLGHPCVDYESDVVITNWADIPVDEETTLGLGLGPAEWTRKLSREHASFDCVLLPLGGRNGCEVLIQLAEPEMQRLLEDTGLQPFLVGYA